MCGIGLIVSGLKLIGPFTKTIDPFYQLPCKDKSWTAGPTIHDLIKALGKRGPDQTCSETIYVRTTEPNKPDFKNDSLQLGSYEDDGVSTILQFVGASLQLRGISRVLQPLKDTDDNLLVYNGEVFGGLAIGSEENDAEVIMYALQKCCSCPCHANHATLGNCLCSKEGQFVENHITVTEVLSCIRGPWALIFWQDKSKTLWFGRDMLGRRSLLVHWPSQDDARLLFSSVAPFSMTEPECQLPGNAVKDINSMQENSVVFSLNTLSFAGKSAEADHVTNPDLFQYWEELPCTIHSIVIKHEMEILSRKNEGLNLGQSFDATLGWLMMHDWQESSIKKIILWERNLVNPGKRDGRNDCHRGREDHKGDMAIYSSLSEPHAQGSDTFGKNLFLNDAHVCMKVPVSVSQRDSVVWLLTALKRAVERRTSDVRCHGEPREVAGKMDSFSPVAVLFSGGLDSMILAALADQCLYPNCAIDLLNVSFEYESPDRLSAIAGVEELKKISPSRRWRLIEIDGTISNVNKLRPHLLSLICPSKTYMDLNIGTALWLAASGDGWIEEELCRKRYRSDARILLVGTGADEQCGGYSRHRTKFKLGGWEALQNEMRLDMQRLWKRNLGRDDRCIADHGKEARFPYLDEEVIQTLLDLPLWEIANLEQPIGQGDKKILREVAMYLGLEGVASLPKRAIQFGSRISRESNKSNFGSNRAANQASAGSAIIHCLGR